MLKNEYKGSDIGFQTLLLQPQLTFVTKPFKAGQVLVNPCHKIMKHA